MERTRTESEKQYEYMEQMKQWVEKQSQKLGRPLTCHCTTFGCQMNEKDSEKLARNPGDDGISGDRYRRSGYPSVQYLYGPGKRQHEAVWPSRDR